LLAVAGAVAVFIGSTIEAVVVAEVVVADAVVVADGVRTRSLVVKKA
jgi:hypothetical protein